MQKCTKKIVKKLYFSKNSIGEISRRKFYFAAVPLFSDRSYSSLRHIWVGNTGKEKVNEGGTEKGKGGWL